MGNAEKINGEMGHFVEARMLDLGGTAAYFTFYTPGLR
jgi:hypothetical protein